MLAQQEACQENC